MNHIVFIGTPPPSSLPCDPAHPAITIERFQGHVSDLMANGGAKLKSEYNVINHFLPALTIY